MFTSNPFAELTVFLPPLVMQVYIVIMIVAVAGGTVSIFFTSGVPNSSHFGGGNPRLPPRGSLAS